MAHLSNLEGTSTRSQLDEPDKRLAEHIMILYWWGEVSLARPGEDQGLVERFFECAPLPHRKYALEFMGRSLSQSEGVVDPEILQRLSALWQWRLHTVRAKGAAERGETAELAAFGAWFMSGEFEPEWAVGQLKEVLSLAYTVDPPYMVVEDLSKLLATGSVTLTDALDCIALLVEGIRHAPTGSFFQYGWVEVAKPILVAGICSKENTLRDRAVQLVHLLGASGYPHAGLEELLDSSCD